MKLQNPTQLEDELMMQIRASGIPEPEREFRFFLDRKFRYDFAWPQFQLAVEIQGGIWMPKAGHNTGKGIERDTEKLNLAQVNGIRCLQVTAKQIRDGRALRWIELALDR